MSHHTPGPWVLSDWTQDDGPNKTTLTAYRAPQDDFERRLYPTGRVPIRIADFDECENVEGNAPLLIAAPELVAALTAAVKHCGHAGHCEAYLNKPCACWYGPARDALAKTKGE